MKKVAAIALCVMMAVPMLSSCNSLTPAQRFERAIEKNQALTSKEVNYTMDMSLNVESFEALSIDLSAQINCKTVFEEENPKMSADLNMDMMGQTVTSSLCYLDGYLYQNVLGVKTKERLSFQEIENRMSVNSSLDLSKIDLSKIETEELDDGLVFKFSLSDSEAQALLNGLLGQLENLNQGKPTIEKVSCEFTSNPDGLFTKEKIWLEFRVDISGQVMNGSITLDGTVINPGQDVEIILEHPEEYQEAASCETEA